MTARKNLLTGLAVVGALCIGFLIGISVEYPRTDRSDAAGTVGKAVKYRNATMTARDIELRSELTKDTAKLKSMIRDMTYFSLLTEQVGKSLDLSLISFRSQGMGGDPEEAGQLKKMLEYSEFIRNNNRSLNSTIAMLNGIYSGDSTDQSVDLEKNLMDFGTYLTNLQEKNSFLNQAVVSLDHFMLSKKILQVHQNEIVKLKSVRDQLVINALQIMGTLGSKDQMGIIIEGVLSSEEKLGIILWGTDKVGMFNTDNMQKSLLNGMEKLSIILSTDQSLGLKAMNSAVVYDQDACRLIILDRGDLSSRVLSTEKLQILLLFGKENLNIILSECTLDRLMLSLVYNQALNASSVDAGFSSFLNSFEGMHFIAQFLASEKLGRLL